MMKIGSSFLIKVSGFLLVLSLFVIAEICPKPDFSYYENSSPPSVPLT